MTREQQRAYNEHRCEPVSSGTPACWQPFREGITCLSLAAERLLSYLDMLVSVDRQVTSQTMGKTNKIIIAGRSTISLSVFISH